MADNEKLSQKSSAHTLDGTELVYVVQDGVTKKGTAQLIADLAISLVPDPPAPPVTSVNGQTGTVVLDPADLGAEPANANIQSHISSTGNPHGTTAADVPYDPDLDNSGLAATDVQAALDEINTNVSYLGFESYTAPSVTTTNLPTTGDSYYNIAAKTVRFPAGGVYSDGVEEYIVPAVTAAGQEVKALDGELNIIYADYNAGNPIWAVSNSMAVIDFQSAMPYARLYKRAGSTFLHTQPFTELFTCVPERIVQRLVNTSEYARESGLLILTESGFYGVTQGHVWIGADRVNVPDMPLALLDGYFDCMYMGTVEAWDNGAIYRKGQGCTYGGKTWVSIQDDNENVTPVKGGWWQDAIEGSWGVPKLGTVSTTGTATAGHIDNMHYMDEVTGGLRPLTEGHWTINYIYRGIEEETHTYRVLGTQDFGSKEEAQASSKLSALPSIITSHAMLIGRIIVQEGETDPANYITESAFETRFTSTASISQHNQLTDIQGGAVGERYHLTQAQHDNYHNITISTADPSGGVNGDIWIKYVP